MTIEEKVNNKIEKERDYLGGVTQETILKLMKDLSLNDPTNPSSYTVHVREDFASKFNKAMKDEVNRAKDSRKNKKRKSKNTLD